MESHNKIAKNLLLNQICENCGQSKGSEHENMCLTWWGEACGWQWGKMSDKNTCDQWKKGE